jgi:hypothetical protein
VPALWTALIVANDVYEHDGLGSLRPMRRRWTAYAAIGAFDVEVVRNEAAHLIEDLFADSHPDDGLLLHVSCRGIKNQSGELFFAATDTRPNLLRSTLVSDDDLAGFRCGSVRVLCPLLCVESWLAECRCSREGLVRSPPEDRGPES